MRLKLVLPVLVACIAMSCSGNSDSESSEQANAEEMNQATTEDLELVEETEMVIDDAENAASKADSILNSL